jgi:hypothetical protein
LTLFEKFLSVAVFPEPYLEYSQSLANNALGDPIVSFSFSLELISSQKFVP